MDAGNRDRNGFLLAPTFFGLAFVARKWGLERFPGSVNGAFIGATSALVAISMVDVRDDMVQGFRRRRTHSPSRLLYRNRS